MSHDGPQAVPGGPPGVPGVMTFPAPAVGEVLVNRYRLEEHVGTDTTGRQIWRAVDGVLNRAVALVIRQPGGDAAAGMTAAAVAASRLAHPHLVAVYDAIDERHRAYVVREWIPGIALRDVLLQAPLDAERSVLVTHAITEAVAALHAAGIVHGSIGPSAIIIADDGRVVLTDPHPDASADGEYDVRAIGAVLYACLTGHWPSEFGPSTLPDARRDGAGRIVAPRQVRAGIPPHLDEIASDLLSPQMQAPAAAPLAAEFARLATQGSELEYDDGPIGFADHDAVGGGRRRAGGKLALGVAMLATIAVVGAFIGARVLGQDPQNGPTGSAGTPQVTSPAVTGPGAAIPVSADQVRVVDPPTGDRQELAGIERVVDGKDTTGWATDEYNRANFGGLKPGMGVLIDLGAPTKVGAVRVVVSHQGATMELRSGPTDPGNDTQGDDQIAKTYTSVSNVGEDHSGTVIVFPVTSQENLQYLLVWVTKLPPNGKGKFAISINEIAVHAP